CGIAEEVGAAFEMRRRRAEAEPGFMHKRGGVQRLRRALARECAPRQLAQVFVQLRMHGLERRGVEAVLVARPPRFLVHRVPLVATPMIVTGWAARMRAPGAAPRR